ncbi:MAG: hypothetical protein ABW148_13950 [Sedimenticola sp.]
MIAQRSTGSVMSAKTLLSIIESATHPNFGALYRHLGLQETRVASIRKAIALLKKLKPDYVVAEFFYGYGNNYAGVNVSNLDVFLASLQKYAPQAKVIVMVSRQELEHVVKLQSLFPVHVVLTHPVAEAQLESVLE